MIDFVATYAPVKLVLSLLCLTGSIIAAIAQSPDLTSPDFWKTDRSPFAFKYDGKDSSTFLASWTRTEKNARAASGPVHQIIYTDPATKLKVVVEIRSLKDFPAIDWVLYFSNEGTTDTPILHQHPRCPLPESR
jgi:hypothetical protein